MNKIVALIAAVAISTGLFAQLPEQLPYRKGFELYGSAAAGYNDLMYKVKGGSQTGGPGLNFGLGTAFFINQHWGFSTGGNFSVYTAFSSLPANSSFLNKTVDSDGQPYYLHFLLNEKIKEFDLAYRFEIPLMAHYRYYLSSGDAVYGALGANYSMPLGGYFTVTSGKITTTGDLGQATELSNIPWLDFVNNQTVKNSHGKIPLRSTFTASIELGYLHNLSKTNYLTVSLLGDYGLQNLRRGKTQTSLMYNSFQYTGFPCSDYVDKVNLMSIGIKVAFHINLSSAPLPAGKKKTIEQPTKKGSENQNNPNMPMRRGGRRGMGINGM